MPCETTKSIKIFQNISVFVSANEPKNKWNKYKSEWRISCSPLQKMLRQRAIDIDRFIVTLRSVNPEICFSNYEKWFKRSSSTHKTESKKTLFVFTFCFTLRFGLLSSYDRREAQINEFGLFSCSHECIGVRPERENETEIYVFALFVVVVAAAAAAVNVCFERGQHEYVNASKNQSLISRWRTNNN